jgi:hypothetical protein
MNAQEWLPGHSFTDTWNTKCAFTSPDKLIRQFETMLAALLLADSTAGKAAHKTLPLRIT